MSREVINECNRDDHNIKTLHDLLNDKTNHGSIKILLEVLMCTFTLNLKEMV